MKLTDLNPEFLTFSMQGDVEVYSGAADFRSAQGVMFECPCGEGHSLMVWFKGRGVPQETSPPPLWAVVSGTGFDDLTLTPSIRLDCWHGFVRDGRAV